MAANPSFAQKRLKRFGEVVRQRHHSLLAPFAPQKNLSWTIELQVRSVDVEGLRDTRSGTSKEEQQSAITSTARCLLIRRIDESGKFASRQITGHTRVRSFDWDGEHPLR
ncbi:hypothetical protein AWB81_06493 [Caballeronia arationis]|nr:hypothetical protein [Caballeronia arationis]SAL03749.1 hypothetical protein AWB81_06493 [Caballeronia arationis]